MSNISIKNKKIHKIEIGDIFVHRGYPLGNPFVCEPFGPYSREESIKLYQQWFYQQIREWNPVVLDAIRQIQIQKLQGKDFGLVCYCKPLPCHAQVILDYVNQQKYIVNWFSNMAKLKEPIVYQNINYFSVENFYQAMKVDKQDVETRGRVAAMSPYQSKSFGKGLGGEKFHQTKLQIMEFALRQKFNQTSWRDKLVGCTSPIVEYNNWRDVYWGVDVFTNNGENHLGKLLTSIRNELTTV